MRAALLARVSSEAQADEDRHSLPAQLRTMRVYAEDNGWVVVHEFVAPGESASTNDINRRPVLREVMAAARNREFDVLVIHEASRLARDVELAHRLINELEGLGVRIVNASTGQDYYSSSGRFMWTLESGLAEFWRRQMGEHISKGKREAWQRGLHLGPAPLGYVRGANGVLEPVPGEAEAVRKAFALRIQGIGYMEIAGVLAGMGVQPRSQKGYTSFTLSSVQSILENRIYAGDVVYKEQWRPGQHPALISLADFEAAQRVVRHSVVTGREIRCLLTAIAICHACEGPLWMTVTGSRPDTRKPTYREPSKLQFRECPNHSTSWRAHLADAEVERVFKGLAVNREWIEQAKRGVRRGTAARGRSARAIAVERERWGVAYGEGLISQERMRSEVSRLDEEERAKGPDISDLHRRVQTITSIGQIWDDATLAEKREAVRIIFAQVRLDTREKSVFVVPRQEYRPLMDAAAQSVCWNTRDRDEAGIQQTRVARPFYHTRELVA